MSKTVLANVDGFTPLIDAVVQDVGIMTAAVFGKMWRYCQMSDGVCKASQERLADELGNLSRQTIKTHIDKLIEAGYIVDKTPDLQGHPHEYADTGKAGLSINFTGGVKNLDRGCKKIEQPAVQNLDTKKEEDTNKDTPENFPIETKIAAGLPITEKDLQSEQIRKEAINAFEGGLKFGALPWSSNSAWTKFEKFVIAEYRQNPNCFKEYQEWREIGKGKFGIAYSNRKIRENPQAFMDTGWPEFCAAEMYTQPAPHVRYKEPAPVISQEEAAAEYKKFLEGKKQRGQ